MEATRIYSTETLIRTLRYYVKLNRQASLDKAEKELKNDLEAQVIGFLNDLQGYTAQHTKDKKPNYSLELVTKFLKEGCVPYLSDDDDKVILKKEGFINKLTELMAKKGIKSKDVIEATGINQAVFSKAKVGLRTPSKELLKALSAYFKFDFTVYE